MKIKKTKSKINPNQINQIKIENEWWLITDDEDEDDDGVDDDDDDDDDVDDDVWLVGDGPLAVCRARKEPGLLQDGTSSSFSTTWPTTECVGDVGADSQSLDGGGGRDGGDYNSSNSFNNSSKSFNKWIKMITIITIPPISSIINRNHSINE